MSRDTNKRPTHQAFIVIEPRAGSGKKSHWVQIGSIWPHKNGEGFDLAIPAGVSITGRIVCMPRQEDEAPGDSDHEA